MELQELYEHFEEEKRLFHGYASQVEYLTTMHYIHQYANTQAQILEIGAGCGAYLLRSPVSPFENTGAATGYRGSLPGMQKQGHPDVCLYSTRYGNGNGNHACGGIPYGR